MCAAALAPHFELHGTGPTKRDPASELCPRQIQEGPDGGRILMWYSWVNSQLAVLFGGLQGEIAAGRDAIPVFLQAYMHPRYKSDSVLVYGT